MTFKKEISHLLENKKTKIFIQFCIIFSIIVFSIGTISNIPYRLGNILSVLEVFIVWIFTTEYILRVYTSKKKLSFILSFWGIIDLLAIIPFYLSLWTDLTSIRVIRILRVARIFKLGRYSKAITNLKTALWSIKEELILFSILTIILLYLSAVGFYHFENGAQPENITSIFDALRWSVATLTTVWYGDIYPITVWGKFFTFIILMIGLWIVSIPTGLVAGAISSSENKK